MRPGPEDELELQSTFTPKAAQVTLEQSNFGLFAVRVAAGVASYWGDGEITSSEGAQGEPAIFGQSAAWMDYSGAVAARRNGKRVMTESYFDNQSQLSLALAVREDGWISIVPS